MALRYPSTETIIAYNELALAQLAAKKADRHEVRSREHLRRVLEEIRAADGDVYAKAVVLLTGLVRAHAFASGNRRTAVLVTKDFLLSNGATFGVTDDPRNARILQGVREGFYTPAALQVWLRTGVIHAFTRQYHSRRDNQPLP